MGQTGGHRIPWNGEVMGSLLFPCAPPGGPWTREGAWAMPRLRGSRGRLQWRSRRGTTGWAHSGWWWC